MCDSACKVLGHEDAVEACIYGANRCRHQETKATAKVEISPRIPLAVEFFFVERPGAPSAVGEACDTSIKLPASEIDISTR
jgi:hypothetical protein